MIDTWTPKALALVRSFFQSSSILSRGVVSCCRDFCCKIEIKLRLQSISLNTGTRVTDTAKNSYVGSTWNRHETERRQALLADLHAINKMPYLNILGYRGLDALQMHSTKLIITGFITMLLFSRFCGIMLLFFVYSVTN